MQIGYENVTSRLEFSGAGSNDPRNADDLETESRSQYNPVCDGLEGSGVPPTTQVVWRLSGCGTGSQTSRWSEPGPRIVSHLPGL